jgi:hypothetical protein
MSGRVSDAGTLAIEEVDTDDMRTRRLKADHARSRQATRKRCSPPPSDLLFGRCASDQDLGRECWHAEAVVSRDHCPRTRNSPSSSAARWRSDEAIWCQIRERPFVVAPR